MKPNRPLLKNVEIFSLNNLSCQCILQTLFSHHQVSLVEFYTRLYNIVSVLCIFARGGVSGDFRLQITPFEGNFLRDSKDFAERLNFCTMCTPFSEWPKLHFHIWPKPKAEDWKIFGFWPNTEAECWIFFKSVLILSYLQM